MKDAKNFFDLSGEFQQAFDFFNRELFREKLEQVIITLQKHRGANGYFRANSFEERSFEEGKQQPPKFTVHEISIMPDAMYHRTDREVLATLVHEMCHLKQKQYGTPSRNGYHNRQWAEYMQAVGLEPTAFDKYDSRNPELSEEEKAKSPGEGKSTGQKVSHFIIPGGAFDRACRKLLESGFQLNLHQLPILPVPQKKSKLKYTCPQCGSNAWAKPDTKLYCGECMITMECEEEDDDND